jgi:uncharacterized membrane protein (DUF2068 family)
MTRRRGAEAKAPGVRLIFAYKLIKAALEAVLAGVLLYGARHGLAGWLTRLAERLQDEAVHAWSNIVAAKLLSFAHVRHGLAWTAAAIAGDALLSGVEGYALWQGHTWGEWLVVGTTASLIPFEIYELTRRLRPGRLVLLLVNLAVVVYLAGRARHRAVT